MADLVLLSVAFGIALGLIASGQPIAAMTWMLAFTFGYGLFRVLKP